MRQLDHAAGQPTHNFFDRRVQPFAFFEVDAIELGAKSFDIVGWTRTVSAYLSERFFEAVGQTIIDPASQRRRNKEAQINSLQ